MMSPLDDPELESPRNVAPGWMITFADLLSLLLTFFVLVFATTTVEQQDWQRVVEPISAYLTGRTMTAPTVLPAPETRARLDLSYVSTLIDRLLSEDAALTGTHVSRLEHAVVLTLANSATPNAATPPFADLARLLSGLDNRIEIRAHTGIDPSPHAAPIADWRRALGHAQAIAAELARLGYDRPIDASGMADLPDGPQAGRVELEIGDSAAEAPRAAP
ncbi:MAG: flagellar motor protein MotB [Aliidongia sp.]